MVSARLIDRGGGFIETIDLQSVFVVVQFQGRHFVATGKPWKRADGTIEQDYAEQGVYCVSNPPKQ